MSLSKTDLSIAGLEPYDSIIMFLMGSMISDAFDAIADSYGFENFYEKLNIDGLIPLPAKVSYYLAIKQEGDSRYGSQGGKQNP